MKQLNLNKGSEAGDKQSLTCFFLLMMFGRTADKASSEIVVSALILLLERKKCGMLEQFLQQLANGLILGVFMASNWLIPWFMELSNWINFRAWRHLYDCAFMDIT